MELLSGALLQGGKYKIEKSLGQGGFGITYLAEQTNLGRKVCVKEFFMKEYGERTTAPEEDSQETVLTSGGHPAGQIPNDKDATVLTGVSAVTSAAAAIMGRYREKFVKEARTIARLDHPGIVRIHDVFEENGTAYYVMDFIEGENLNDLVKREGALSEERALDYIRQVADALSYVHAHNIMHLDVKPANIIVRKSDDKAILIDFGTAKQYDSEGTQTSTTPVGLSVGYAPIEMTKPGGVQTFSPETDVYSLGATLYYLVTGQNPPDASERMEMIMDGEKFKFPEIISATTATVIEQSMQARKKRIQSVGSFLDLLDTDHEKERLEAEKKTAEEVEAKRQVELRLEREKEEAERKRAAEEEARRKAEAEQKRIAEEKARIEAANKAEQEIVQKKSNSSGRIIGFNAFFIVGGLVMFILALSNVNYNPWPSSFDPYGYFGFGAFIVSFILSLICLSRKASKGFSWLSLALSALLGFICLYDAIDEDSLEYYPFGSDYCNPYSFSRDESVAKAYYDNSNINSITNNTASFALSTEASTYWFPFKMPTDVFVRVGNQQGTDVPTVSSMLQSEYHISKIVSTNTPYFLIEGNTLTIYNLAPGTLYYVFFYLPDAIQSYGVFGSLKYSVWANQKVYSFQTTNNWY